MHLGHQVWYYHFLHFHFHSHIHHFGIPFLDMLICNQDGKLSSKWYRKPTDTGLTLNYHALAPLKYKKSVISSFIYRIYRASSNWPPINTDNFHNFFSILATSNSLTKLMTLEALFIKEFKPALNTKDEYKSRTLTLKF